MTTFIASATISLIGSTPIVALINPSGSGKTVTLLSVTLVGSNIPSLRLERYDVVLTTVPIPAATLPTVYSFDSPGATAVGIMVTRDDHTITEPSDTHLDFVASVYDGETNAPVPVGAPLTMPAGTSMAIDTAAFSGSPGAVTFILVWSES